MFHSYAQTQLLRSLAGRAQTAPEVDALIGACGIDRHPVRVGALPSPEVCATLLRGSIGEALTIATHPQLDSTTAWAAARDRRKTLRRALAANPAAPADLHRILLDEALEARDDQTLEALTAAAALDVALPAARSLPWSEPVKTDAAWSQIAHSPAAALARNVLARDPQLSCAGDLPHAVVYHVGNLVADDAELAGRVLRSVQDDATAALTFAAGAWCSDITHDLAEPVVDVLVQRLTAGDVQGWEWAVTALSHCAPPMSTGALERLATCGTDLVRAALAQGVASRGDRVAAGQLTDQLDVLAAAPTRAVAAQVLAAPACREALSDAQYNDLAGHLTGGDHLLARTILHAARPLMAEALLHLLRNGDVNTTAEWVAGRLTHSPSLELFTELVSDPGQAFGRMLGSRADLVEVLHLLGRTPTGLTGPLPDFLLPLEACLVRYAALYPADPLGRWALELIVEQLAGRPAAQMLLVSWADAPPAGSLADLCRAALAATSD